MFKQSEGDNQHSLVNWSLERQLNETLLVFHEDDVIVGVSNE